ncbi:hypothetical protein BSK59_15735 [Paenibacillus odorifer]|uniref:hypothetical protein n=1 Tax=Paenibacillus odorifer TaxID=189426 RepID=UPI00097A3B01|nr:hypothetical protein [Paenibacillus odorifer]OME54031.1 hypothetical protein BSK59_15735 [Paenibacillus odorifer]
MDYRKLNKIVLTNDDALKIMKWDHENHKKYTSIEYPLTEGVLLVTGYIEEYKKEITTGTYFKAVSDGMEFALIEWSEMKELASFKMDHNMPDGKFTNVKYHYKGMTYDELHSDFAKQSLLVLATFQYMNNHKEIVQERRVRTSITKKNKHKQPSQKSRTVKLTRVEYVLDFTKEEYGDKRQYERKTESWHQRGFWRHYKSGKRVWIAEQTKGSGKNIEPKTYTM